MDGSGGRGGGGGWQKSIPAVGIQDIGLGLLRLRLKAITYAPGA